MVAAKINTSTTSYYQYPVYDQPGNVRRIVNAAGAVTGSFEYNAFGELLLNNPPPEGTRFGFSVPAWIMLKDDPDGRFVLTPNPHGQLGDGEVFAERSCANRRRESLRLRQKQSCLMDRCRRTSGRRRGGGRRGSRGKRTRSDSRRSRNIRWRFIGHSRFERDSGLPTVEANQKVVKKGPLSPVSTSCWHYRVSR